MGREGVDWQGSGSVRPVLQEQEANENVEGGPAATRGRANCRRQACAHALAHICTWAWALLGCSRMAPAGSRRLPEAARRVRPRLGRASGVEQLTLPRGGPQPQHGGTCKDRCLGSQAAWVAWVMTPFPSAPLYPCLSLTYLLYLADSVHTIDHLLCGEHRGCVSERMRAHACWP